MKEDGTGGRTEEVGRGPSREKKKKGRGKADKIRRWREENLVKEREAEREGRKGEREEEGSGK